MAWELSTVKDVSLVVGGVVAFITLVVGFVEYGRRNHERKVLAFVDMRRRFLENPDFQEILSLLDGDNPELTRLPLQQRRNFLGFLEELALLTRSDAMRDELAHYMFGRYVLLADRSENLWAGLDRDDRYWRVFREFAQEQHAFERRPLPVKRVKI